MGVEQLSNMLASMLNLKPDQDDKPKSCKYHAYLKATKDFIAYHANLMRKHFLNGHFREMSLDEQRLCWKFHWALALKAITNFKRYHKVPTEQWVRDMIHRASADEDHLFGLTIDYFLGFARATVGAYELWFADLKESKAAN